ncbi:hypothetical protein [Pseudomonas lopnurensis]|uniref:hypothetical protein n=1 Tax=Pseudomonas lopnurensis TaxID=1477517 RepID=UPI0028AD3A88|nr:hypothetical protein [Pseudomonas lopnurensis]
MSQYLPILALGISVFAFGLTIFSHAAYRRNTRQTIINAADIQRTVTHSARGIYKRLDELREIETFLREELPDLAQEKPWVFGWIQGQRIWMTDLIEQLEKSSPEFCQYSLRQRARYK